MLCLPWYHNRPSVPSQDRPTAFPQWAFEVLIHQIFIIVALQQSSILLSRSYRACDCNRNPNNSSYWSTSIALYWLYSSTEHMTDMPLLETSRIPLCILQVSAYISPMWLKPYIATMSSQSRNYNSLWSGPPRTPHTLTAPTCTANFFHAFLYKTSPMLFYCNQ